MTLPKENAYQKAWRRICEKKIKAVFASWDQGYGAEGRALLYGAMTALVDLPGVANPLEDDWCLLEECASGLVMGRLSQDVGTDEVVSLR